MFGPDRFGLFENLGALSPDRGDLRGQGSPAKAEGRRFFVSVPTTCADVHGTHASSGAHAGEERQKCSQMRKREISAILRHGAAADERKTPALGDLPRGDIEVATLDALSFVR